MGSETRRLNGQVVAITGASAGIGEACARALHEKGAFLALGARRDNRLRELVEEFGSDRAVGVVTDVRKPAECNDLIKAAVEKFGRLDSVIPNAGTGFYAGICDYDDEAVADVIDTNYAGTVWTIRAAVPQFRKQGDGGDIVIVASVAGFRGGGNEAVYTGTKHAQVGLAGSLDRELRSEGIRVTLICPAAVETEYALGRGRTAGDAQMANYLRADDVAHAVVTVLEQPRRVRTTVWQLWSIHEPS
jgi:3-oxoacyl-[acyl-carrier protein] reductase